jgi:hypothetical protein
MIKLQKINKILAKTGIQNFNVEKNDFRVLTGILIGLLMSIPLWFIIKVIIIRIF